MCYFLKAVKIIVLATVSMYHPVAGQILPSKYHNENEGNVAFLLLYRVKTKDIKGKDTQGGYQNI